MKKLICYIISLFSIVAYSQNDLLQKAEEHLFTDQDSAHYYLDKLYKTTIENKDWIKAIEALNTKNIGYAYHGNFLKFQYFIQKEDSLLLEVDHSINGLPEYAYHNYLHWYNKGNYYYTLHDYDKAEDYFFKILNSIEQYPDTIIKSNYADFMIVSNNFLATMYRNEFKYELAKEFYNQNLILHKKFDDHQEKIYDTKNLIASLKSAEKEYDLSNAYAKESIAYYLKNFPEENLNSIFSASILLVNNYIKLKQLKNAKNHLKKITPYLKKENRFYSDFIELSAKIAILEGNTREALGLYDSALKLLIDSQGGADKIALTYKEIGDVYFLNKEPQNAIKYYNKGMQLFSKDSNTDKNFQHKKANSKTNILQLINASSKAHVLLGKPIDYEKIIKNGDVTIKNINSLRKTYNDDVDKQTLVENVLPIFENSIEASYQLYTTSQNTAYIDTAFVFFERSKSTILLDALYKNNATKFSGIPEDLLEKEKILKVTIAQLEKKIKTQDKKVQDQLFKRKREYEMLIKTIEENHPAYFDLKHNTEVASLHKVQKNLHPYELVLSYFYGDNAVYIISITNNKKAIFKISYDTIDIQNMLELQQMISDPKTNISNLAKVSFPIYQKFVAPAITTTGIKKIVIMPDGILRNIPFEALNITDGKIDYLINKLDVSYINSATLWFQLQKRNVKRAESLLAFAPSFNNHSDFSNLPNATREVTQINHFFKGNVFMEKEATLENFRMNIENHNIIHLATHAQTDNEIPEYSFLAFTPNEKEENLIYVNDLYAMNINADMVVLSACKSGMGDLKKGEGLLSLSRAFYYAGAKSLVYTLWNINDSSSSEIMENFYENLSDGALKDEALRNAKLTFLEKHKEDNFKHPYYWSSFVISGNTTPLVSDSYLVWYIAASVLLIAIVVFRRKLQ